MTQSPANLMTSSALCHHFYHLFHLISEELADPQQLFHRHGTCTAGSAQPPLSSLKNPLIRNRSRPQISLHLRALHFVRQPLRADRIRSSVCHIRDAPVARIFRHFTQEANLSDAKLACHHQRHRGHAAASFTETLPLFSSVTPLSINRSSGCDVLSR